MDILTVAGATFPVPQEYKWSVYTVGFNNRTADAKLHKVDVADKARLDLKWATVDKAEWASMLTAMGQTFNVTYFDPNTNGLRTCEMYVGDRSCEMLKFQNGDPIYLNCSMPLIEC